MQDADESVPYDNATIDQLPARVAALPPDLRALAEQLFEIVEAEGVIAPPPEMEPWLARTFGEVEATLRQRIIRVTNRWTFEGATFNPLRSRRPGSGATQTATQATTQAGPLELPPELRERIAATEGDDFCDPEHRTPADSFGRVRGRHVVTAANVAKAEGWHSVAIFDRHDPLAIDSALIADLLAVAGTWAQRAHEAENDARYFFLLWNCLQRAGASLIHGHAQMTLSTTMAHGRVELWRTAAARYRQETGGGYFADLAAVHAALGLAVPIADSPVTLFASLTPAKEREFVLLADPWRDDGNGGQRLALESLAEPLAAALEVMLHTLGVRAFNVAIFGPPLPGDPRAAKWASFPLVARFVDRGNPLAPTSDIAALELFGSSVIASDPFDVARSLRAG
ncbi:MAG TPA: hypothetical protein VGF38_05220 [Ktedonobacterales bacterium]|jgi:hypothetical protein